jgi:hypothetical protein
MFKVAETKNQKLLKSLLETGGLNTIEKFWLLPESAVE